MQEGKVPAGQGLACEQGRNLNKAAHVRLGVENVSNHLQAGTLKLRRPPGVSRNLPLALSMQVVPEVVTVGQAHNVAR